MVFWIAVAVVLVLVLAGARFYDRRRGTRRILPPEHDGTVGQARTEVGLRNLRDLGGNGPGL
ncbi:MAG TPA: hypothetical protein VFE15_15595 [Marmoricola sp.]|jgi:hypothetical protein|nr:hypothetical protein [Marmoricola sp.]